MRIAVVGMGEMGSAVARRLVDGGADVLTAVTGRSDETVARARAAGARLVEMDALASTDMVLSIVPPVAGWNVIDALAPALAEVEAKPLFLECNPLSPTTKQAMAERLGALRCAMVDVGIVGGPPQPGSERPVFFMSGTEAIRAAWLERHGIRVHVVGATIGAAARVKLTHSAVSKGLTAIATAALLDAQAAGEALPILGELDESLAPLMARLRRTIPSMVPKAARWADELREVAACFADREGMATLFEGAATVFDGCADERQDTLRQLCELLNKPPASGGGRT